MSQRAGEDVDRAGGCDDAALRSVSGAAPCGRKESGNDRGRVGRGGGCHRRGRRWRAAIAQSADQAAEQDVTGRRGLRSNHKSSKA